MKKNLRSFIYFFIFVSCALTNFLSADVNSTSNTPPNFDDVLLVVQYNHPYYGTIPFIKELYSPLFPNIVFYGEKQDPEVTCITTTVGVYLARVMVDVFEKYPNYNGYIFLQDDCLMNVWNYSRLDKNKFWFAIARYPSCKEGDPLAWDSNFDRSNARAEFTRSSFDGSYQEFWGWWKTEHGLAPLRQALPMLLPSDWAQLEANVGKNIAITQVCDMFYVPQRFSADVLRLSRAFKNVFYEISVPMTLCCLDSIDNWELLKMQWGIPQEHFLTYRMDVDWVHPIKFSKPECKDFARQVINQYYQSLTPPIQ